MPNKKREMSNGIIERIVRLIIRRLSKKKISELLWGQIGVQSACFEEISREIKCGKQPPK